MCLFPEQISSICVVPCLKSSVGLSCNLHATYVHLRKGNEQQVKLFKKPSTFQQDTTVHPTIQITPMCLRIWFQLIKGRSWTSGVEQVAEEWQKSTQAPQTLIGLNYHNFVWKTFCSSLSMKILSERQAN